jgi:TM2 domain-containing membrane protein YozV
MTSSLTPTQAPSEKSRGVATVLAAVLGPFGAHRFYLGKARSGVLMLATLGGLGIWWLYDIILIVSGSFRDSENRLVTRWDPEVGPPAAALPQEVYDELDALRSELAELSERLDFTERLLAQPGHDEALRRPIHPS